MSTNHNRIRVADLETNQPNKILKTNEKGELEFSDSNNLQTENYNALDCTTEGKSLDARQGKVLKDMIDNIDISPSSLVNDLTTGGTDKALTAEMGKELNERKHPLEDQRLSQDQTVKFGRVIVKEDKYAIYMEPFRVLSLNEETYISTRLTPDAIIAQSHDARKLEVKYNSINFVEDPYSDKKGSLQTQFLTGARTWKLQDKDGIIALVNDFVITPPGNDIRPSLIIPNGTLTTIPADGAIERDSNGQLWETHNGVRSQIATTAFVEQSENNNLKLSENQTFSGVKTATNTSYPQNAGIVINNTSDNNDSKNIALSSNSGTSLFCDNAKGKGILSQTNSGYAGHFYSYGNGIALYANSPNSTNKTVLITGNTKNDNVYISNSGTGTNIKSISTGSGSVFTGSNGTENTSTISKEGNITAKSLELGAGNNTTPPLIIPKGTLTTTLKEGAIERDENGQLWETHQGVRRKIGAGTAEIEIKGEFNNNAQALAANLKPGDYYSRPFDSENGVAFIAVVKKLYSYMRLSFRDINATVAYLNISDKNNINDWNNYFSSKGSSTFSRVIVDDDNSAKFIAEDPSLITTIKLDNSQLNRVDFGYLDEITDIDLSDNEITSFSPITTSKKLINLKLSNNRISWVHFHPEVPNTLKNINLNKNSLQNFSINIPNSLETLLLSENQLHDWECTTQQQANLKLLDLSDNSFIEFNMYNNLPEGLEVLKLSHNYMYTFLPLKQLPSSLQRLELNDNNLVDFDLNYLAGDKLKTLLLHNNKIEIFKPKMLNDSLQELTLGNNNIGNFNPTPMPSKLTVLSLENNPITTTSWNTNYQWAEGLSENGTMYAGGTTGLIDGTNTESLLLDLNWTILKTPCPAL